jgi:hypothetical protein
MSSPITNTITNQQHGFSGLSLLMEAADHHIANNNNVNHSSSPKKASSTINMYGKRAADPSATSKPRGSLPPKKRVKFNASSSARVGPTTPREYLQKVARITGSTRATHQHNQNQTMAPRVDRYYFTNSNENTPIRRSISLHLSTVQSKSESPLQDVKNHPNCQPQKTMHQKILESLKTKMEFM